MGPGENYSWDVLEDIFQEKIVSRWPGLDVGDGNLSFWSQIQLKHGNLVFIPDYFHTPGIVFPTRRRWMLFSRRDQPCTLLTPWISGGWIMNSCWALEFPLRRGIAGAGRFFGSEFMEFLSKVQFSTGAAPASSSSAGVRWQIHPNSLEFSGGSI